MKHLIKFSLFFLFTSCQKMPLQETQILKSKTLSYQEKANLLPNALFMAVLDQIETDQIKKIINQNGNYLLETNQFGDTPLGLAIKMYNLETALFLAHQLDPVHYMHQNHKGESYLYLSSKNGFVDLIQFLSNRFHARQNSLFIDYEFSDLDLETHQGERALHVARNSTVAETLQAEYGRDLEYPMRKFTFLQNKKGQSFLHTAVRDQNMDLLRWGVHKTCSKTENTSWFYKLWVYGWEAVQKFGKSIWLDWDNLINTQDEKGLTALNYAAQRQNLMALEILSACLWSDYFLPDHKGNTVVHNFLLSLDPLKKTYRKDIKKAFLSLIKNKTLLTLSGVKETMDRVNNEGNTVLHISANLADSFFYEELSKYGHVEAKNKDGKTAREIFKNKTYLLNL